MSSERKKFDGFTQKKFIASLIGILLGISLIPTSFLLSSDTQIKTESIHIESNFGSILLEMKETTEEEINELLEEIENDPLNGLFMDLMPSSEEIFFAEWANDSFPNVHIPLIGHLIESIGASKIGDVDLDGQAPFADLNISSHYNPSILSQKQCQAIWDLNNSNSLVTETPNTWVNLLEGDSENFNLLKTVYNLTEFQLVLIIDWVNVSINSWMNIFSQRRKTVNIYNTLLLLGLIGGGTAVGTLGAIGLYLERRKRQKP